MFVTYTKMKLQTKCLNDNVTISQPSLIHEWRSFIERLSFYMKTHTVSDPTKKKNEEKRKKEKQQHKRFENNPRKPKSNSTLLISYTSFAAVCVCALDLLLLLLLLLLCRGWRCRRYLILFVSSVQLVRLFCRLQRFNLVMVGLI